MRLGGLALLLALLPFGAMAQAVPARTISVSSEAEIHQAPDRVTLQLGINEQSQTLAEAQKRTNEQLKALDRVAKAMNIPADKIQTANSNTNPIYRYENAKRVFDGYSVNHQISLILDAPDQLGALMEKLTAAGIDEINNVQYGLKDEQGAKIAALKKAAAGARAKAEQLAGAMGEKLGKVLSISESGTSYQPIPMPMMRMAKGEARLAAAPAPNPPAGGLTITTNVQATFALQD